MATIKPFALLFVPANMGLSGDHAVNSVSRRDDGVGMRQKRPDVFRAT